MKMKKSLFNESRLLIQKKRQQMQSMPVLFKLAWCYCRRGQGVRHFTLSSCGEN